MLDFYVGNSRMLRDRIARALPAWSKTMPGYHALLGMHAFGLEECADYARAEIVGADLVEGRGGRVVRVRLVEGFSTTKLVERLRAPI